MRWFTFLLAACCVGLPSAYASDEASENVSAASPAGETDSSDVSTADQITISLKQFREVESAFQNFLKPQVLDPSETVIRVYDADGKFEERKVRFGSVPRDFVLDMRQREERVKARSTVDAIPEAIPSTVTFPSLAAHPFLYAPIDNSCR